MGRRIYPKHWDHIVRLIKQRADYRCECGTFWNCRTGNHHNRCPNIEGKRYWHNHKEIKLRVAQIGAEDDFSPNVLIALCLPCRQAWQELKVARAAQAERTRSLEAQMDKLW